MVEIRTLRKLDAADIEQVIGDYVTNEFYQVNYSDTGEQTAITLELTPLEHPHVGRYHHFDAETIQRHNEVLPGGFSFGAYENDQLVGFVIAEQRDWNNSLWVWEFHVALAWRGKGIGRLLMEAAAEKAVQIGLRIIVCETQNRNTGAIKAYRKLGFRVEGIDISYYTNEDFPDRDVAVFMKKRLTTPL